MMAVLNLDSMQVVAIFLLFELVLVLLEKTFSASNGSSLDRVELFTSRCLKMMVDYQVQKSIQLSRLPVAQMAGMKKTCQQRGLMFPGISGLALRSLVHLNHLELIRILILEIPTRIQATVGQQQKETWDTMCFWTVGTTVMTVLQLVVVM